MPPEAFGSPRYWRLTTTEHHGGISIPALGPYPDRGEYELSFTIASPAGEFVQLTPTVARTVAWAIEWSRGRSEHERKEAIDRRIRQEKRAVDQSVDDIMDMDPAPISKERREFLERRIAPQLDIALHAADQRRQGMKSKESRYYASQGALTR